MAPENWNNIKTINLINNRGFLVLCEFDGLLDNALFFDVHKGESY
jgi:hypothetical protein